MPDPLFTADSHLMHRNIIKYVGRPFTTTEEHDEQLIINWNECVPEKGDVYHIGDIAFGSTSDIRKLLARLNGTIHLIKGNHDRNVLKLDRFAWVKDYHKLKLKDPAAPNGVRVIVLSHYAFRVWEQSHYGSWHLYGHSHGALPGTTQSMDVGVDAAAQYFPELEPPRRYRPLTYAIIRGILK